MMGEGCLLFVSWVVGVGVFWRSFEGYMCIFTEVHMMLKSLKANAAWRQEVKFGGLVY